MTDDPKKDRQLQEELRRLGEPEATTDEVTEAHRLADRLDGHLQAVRSGKVQSEQDDLAGLARVIRGTADQAEPSPVEQAVARRVVDQVLDKSTQDAGDSATEVDELELRRSDRLARAVDRMIAGMPVVVSDESADLAELICLAGMIRAASHAAHLPRHRVEGLVDEAQGQVPSRATAPRRLRLVGAVAGLALAAALAVVVVGTVLLSRMSAPPAQVPAHLVSRSTRDILPGVFPRSQTASERMDLIYHDRLRSYRDLSLGALGPPGRGRD